MSAVCDCGRDYDDRGGRYSSCWECYRERRRDYLDCIYCGTWHSPEYSTCYRCRRIPGRDDAARAVRLDVLIRDGFHCAECGSLEDLQVDHLRPCARGGTADLWNLQVLCGWCNRDKGRDWWPHCRWDVRRSRLVHAYAVAGFALLDEEQRDRLRDEWAAYGRRPIRGSHRHWPGLAVPPVDRPSPPPDWIDRVAAELAGGAS